MDKYGKPVLVWILVTGLTVVVIGAAVVAGLIFLFKDVGNSDVNHQYVDMYASEQKAILEQILEENEMSYRYANNDVEQYESIKQHLKEENMIIYYDCLGITETKKICQVFGYEDLNDFLLKKNYVDEDGKPSISAMRAATEIYMTEVMRQKN